MPTTIPNAFTSYNFTADERFVLSDLQTQHVQTKRAAIAESKLALQIPTENFSQYIQDEAYLAGQLALLQWLLDESAASREEITKLQNPQ